MFYYTFELLLDIHHLLDYFFKTILTTYKKTEKTKKLTKIELLFLLL